MAEVRLRPWRAEDIDDVVVMAADPFIGPWSSMAADPNAWITREIAQTRGPTRAICVAGDDRALGRVAIRPPEFASDAVRCEAIRAEDQPAGELGYWLVPEARGRGLALAAVQLMLETIVPELGLRSLVLDIETNNAPSTTLAERLGAERREQLRTKEDPHGTARTLVVYVLAL